MRWLDALFWGIAAACATLVVTGNYAWGMQPIQALALLLIVGFSTLAAYLLKRGWRPARFFALAFGVFYVSVLIAFLRNLGVFPVNAFTEYVSTLGTMLHMLLLSLFIVGSYERPAAHQGTAAGQSGGGLGAAAQPGAGAGGRVAHRRNAERDRTQG